MVKGYLSSGATEIVASLWQSHHPSGGESYSCKPVRGAHPHPSSLVELRKNTRLCSRASYFLLVAQSKVQFKCKLDFALIILTVAG
jgi:hypothetical protein